MCLNLENFILQTDVLTLCYYYCFKGLKAFRTEKITFKIFVCVHTCMEECHQFYCQEVSRSILDQKVNDTTYTLSLQSKTKKPTHSPSNFCMEVFTVCLGTGFWRFLWHYTFPIKKTEWILEVKLTIKTKLTLLLFLCSLDFLLIVLNI